jgi:hypothetical protein
MKSWRGNSRGPVIAFLNQFKDRLEEINFDRAGVGAYFADDFEHLGFRNVNGINVGEATRFPDRFRNTKAELYWALRERFQEGQVSGLIDELATAQLASIRYEINPRGLVEIESKDEMRKRGVKSPDRAEAIMLAFADRTPRNACLRQAKGTASASRRSRNPRWQTATRGPMECRRVDCGIQSGARGNRAWSRRISVSKVRRGAGHDDHDQHRRKAVSSGVCAGLVRTNSLQHGCLFAWPSSAPNQCQTSSIESKRVSGVRIHPAPPSSPQFSRSLRKTQKYCACPRVFFDLRAPETLKFGRQQLTYADSLYRESSRCPFATSSTKRTHSPEHRLSAMKLASPFPRE